MIEAKTPLVKSLVDIYLASTCFVALFQKLYFFVFFKNHS